MLRDLKKNFIELFAPDLDHIFDSRVTWEQREYEILSEVLVVGAEVDAFVAPCACDLLLQQQYCCHIPSLTQGLASKVVGVEEEAAEVAEETIGWIASPC